MPLSITAARTGDTVVIRIIGKATAATDAGLLLDLTEYAAEAIRTGCRRFCVDMAECTMVDSTCMGNMMGMTQGPDGAIIAVEIVNASDKIKRCFSSIGLDVMFTFGHTENGCRDCDAVTHAIPDANHSRAAIEDMVLDAHERLLEASPEKGKVFQDVVALLREGKKQRES